MKETKSRAARQTTALGMAVLALCASANIAFAASQFDGGWNLLFVTQYGACDPTYNFSVQIGNGIVFHSNLPRLRGRVARRVPFMPPSPSSRDMLSEAAGCLQ